MSSEKGKSISKFILPQNFEELGACEASNDSIPIRKPGKTNFFTVRKDQPELSGCWLLQDSENNQEYYAVDQGLLPLIVADCRLCKMYVCQYKTGGYFLWPVKLPTEGRLDTWNQSAHKIAKNYAEQWIRILPNKTVGQYTTLEPIGVFAPPEWNLTSEEILEKALGNRAIETLDHPLIKRLRGDF